MLLRGGRDGEILHVAWRTQITVGPQQETDRSAGLQVFVPSSCFVFKLRCFPVKVSFPGVQRRTALRNDCRLLDGSVSFWLRGCGASKPLNELFVL